MLRDHDLVCLSITPWETHLPSSGHYLMREFGRYNRVLFVDHPLTLKDLVTGRSEPGMRDRLRRTLALCPTLRPVPDPARAIWVLTPPPIPPNGLPRSLYDHGLRVGASLVRRAIRQAMATLGMRKPLLWISFDVPLGSRLARTLGERMVIYHCFDEIAGEPYIARHGVRLEEELLRRSDLVLTTSPQLQAAKSDRHPECHYVPNGVDFGHYARATDPRLPIPPDLAVLPAPVLGYLGNLEARLDVELLRGLALARPDWSIVLVGPIQPGYAERIQALTQLPNVHALGPRSAASAPAYLKGFDVALIPFVRTVQTQAIYPLKINEYLAAGRPVVMSPFSELQEFSPLCWIAAGVPAWVAAIHEALGRDDPEALRARQELASRHEWRARAEAVSRILVARLIAQNAQAVSTGRLP